MVIETTRVCNKCGQELPIEDFTRLTSSLNGRRRQCKHCQREQNRAYPDKRPRRPSATDPWKKKANTAVSNALRDGRLVRPEQCEDCGCTCKPEAHHESYDEDKRLDVNWLCITCHGIRHRKYK